ncbi:MAG: hypothetical protein HS128_20730 [Ideonella sp.]|nr:hypothetical protein [Ideonella sp.]
MTERYAHLSPEHLEKTVGIVSFGNEEIGNNNPNLIQEDYSNENSVIKIGTAHDTW